MRKALLILLSLFSSQTLISCGEDTFINESYIDFDAGSNIKGDSLHNKGDSIQNRNDSARDDKNGITRIKITSKIIGKGVIDVPNANFKALPSSQGMAIFNQYMFRLHKTGICCIYDLSDINDIKYVNSYKLGSYNASNHANCAQFDKNINPETGFPNLYVTIGYKALPLGVEKVSLEQSELIQKIIPSNESGGMDRDWIIGDDGYLWGMGQSGKAGTESYKIVFYKLQTPDFSEKEVTINVENAVDYFEDDDEWQNIPKTWQGGMVRNGKLYFLFGTKSVNRQIRIYDTKTHKRIAIIDLNQITKEEPEDLDIFDKDKIIMTLNGVDYAILFEFENNELIP